MTYASACLQVHAVQVDSLQHDALLRIKYAADTICWPHVVRPCNNMPRMSENSGKKKLCEAQLALDDPTLCNIEALPLVQAIEHTEDCFFSACYAELCTPCPSE